MTPASQVFRRNSSKSKIRKEGGEERWKGGKEEGLYSVPRRIQKLSLQVGSNWILVVQVHPAGPSPTCPKRTGSSAKTPAPACSSRPAARTRQAAGGGGGSTHLAYKGSAHLRREEALAGLGAAVCATVGNSCGIRAPNLPTPGGILPTSRCPRGSEVALPRCKGAAIRGGGLMVVAGAGSRPSPGGRVPRRSTGIHPRGEALAPLSPACPPPARPPSGPPARNRFM